MDEQALSAPFLLQEATQLKTEAAIVRMRRIHARRIEQQTPGARAAVGHRRRPDRTLVADATLHAIRTIAEARGGVPGERGSRARGAYLVETTVSSLVMA